MTRTHGSVNTGAAIPAAILSQSETDRLREAALSLARRGFDVFPLRIGAKEPMFSGWQRDATQDEATIRQLWKKPYNIGINCHKNLLVIDIDTKKGKRGLEIATQLFGCNPDELDTIVVKTASGGRHVYLATDTDFSNSSRLIENDFGKDYGIDIRAGGKGYVVGPGSRLVPELSRGQSGDYIELSPDDAEPAPLPAVISKYLVKSGDAKYLKKPDDNVEILEDDPFAVEEAKRYLNRAGPSVEGRGGHDHMVAVIKGLGDFKITKETAIELLFVWNESNLPPFDEDELEWRLPDIWKTRRNPRGFTTWQHQCLRALEEIDIPNEAFEDYVAEEDELEVSDGVAAPSPKQPALTALRKMKLEWFDEAADAALSTCRRPLIDGLLDQEAFSVIYGDSNVGKSFVVLDKAFAVSTGAPWNGRKTTRGLVIYVAAEGAPGLTLRLAALRKRYRDEKGDDAPEPLLAVIRFPIDFLSSDLHENEVISHIRQAEIEKGEKCQWVILDTLARVMAGADENSGRDMGKAVSSANRIQAEAKVHVSYIHHSGKNAALGARGHSSLRAATDTEIEISAGKLKVTKQRDQELAPELAFKLVDMPLGLDTEGQPVKSAVVEWTEPAVAKKQAKSIVIPSNLKMLMEELSGALALDAEFVGEELDPLPAVSEDCVRKRYYKRLAETAENEDPAKLAERQRKGFRRHLDSAIRQNIVMAREYDGQRYLWIRPQPAPGHEGPTIH